MSILISTGEASGDAIGAALLQQLKQTELMYHVYAIGANNLLAEGAELIINSKKWAALGIYQSLKVAPKIYVDYQVVKRWITTNKPELVIAIDFGYFNIKLLRFAKKNGIKTLYFMPPGSWRRNKQGSDLPMVADMIATPFRWSADILRGMGANVEWVGHPILQMVGEVKQGERNRICILPGSRTHEIINNTPIIAKGLEILKNELKDLEVVIVCAPTIEPDYLSDFWRSLTKISAQVSDEKALHVLQSARAAIVCSGTATLEAAVCKTPMVVVYRGDKIMEWEYRIRKPRFEFIGLPSILLQKPVTPELIQWNATPERVASELLEIVKETPSRHQQLQDFEELIRDLGPNDALTRTANLIMKALRG